MDLSEANFKAHQSKIQELQVKVDKLETSLLLALSEHKRNQAIIEQMKETTKKLTDYCTKLEDEIEQDNINAIEASEYE